MTPAQLRVAPLPRAASLFACCLPLKQAVRKKKLIRFISFFCENKN
jgi:hypothetical protein